MTAGRFLLLIWLVSLYNWRQFLISDEDRDTWSALIHENMEIFINPWHVISSELTWSFLYSWHVNNNVISFWRMNSVCRTLSRLETTAQVLNWFPTLILQDTLTHPRTNNNIFNLIFEVHIFESLRSTTRHPCFFQMTSTHSTAHVPPILIHEFNSRWCIKDLSKTFHVHV